MITVDAALFYRFAVALGIGLLVGFERERMRRKGAEMFAGVRTFAILALIGCAAAMISQQQGSALPFVATLIGVAALLVAAHVRPTKHAGVGITTEVTAILTVLTGALCYYEYIALAAALGVAMLVLLSLKPQLHYFAERLTTEDLYAAIKFAVVSLIILPILPNRSFFPPPFDVLNPYNIWWMVVLISAISFAGYVLVKVVDPRLGIGITGLVGGLASSTAVTLTFAGRSRALAALAVSFALAIVAAWAVMFGRVLFIVSITNRALLAYLWIPMITAGVVAALYAFALYRRDRSRSGDSMTFANPFELGTALRFGLLYAVILVVARAAQMYFGTAGVYLAAVVSGTTVLDAITVSMAQLSQTGDIDAPTAAWAIVLAAASNTIVKGGIVLGTGSRQLKWVVLPAVPLILIALLAAAWLG